MHSNDFERELHSRSCSRPQLSLVYVARRKSRRGIQQVVLCSNIVSSTSSALAQYPPASFTELDCTGILACSQSNTTSFQHIMLAKLSRKGNK